MEITLYPGTCPAVCDRDQADLAALQEEAKAALRQMFEETTVEDQKARAIRDVLKSK